MERSNSTSQDNTTEEKALADCIQRNNALIPNGMYTKTLPIRILPNGETVVDWLPTEFSDFIIKYIYSKEERERALMFGNQKIWCG